MSYELVQSSVMILWLAESRATDWKSCLFDANWSLLLHILKGYGQREHLYGPKGVVNTLLRGFVSPTSAHPLARLIQVRQERLPLRQPKQVQLSQRQIT
jgi:hypothetical protein